MLRCLSVQSSLLRAGARQLQQALGRFSTTASAGLTDDQIEFQSVAESFARERLAPHAARWDAQSEFPVEVLREAAGLGFAGLYVDEEHGGAGLSRVDGAVIFEALARGDVASTAYLTM